MSSKLEIIMHRNLSALLIIGVLIDDEYSTTLGGSAVIITAVDESNIRICIQKEECALSAPNGGTYEDTPLCQLAVKPIWPELKVESGAGSVGGKIAIMNNQLFEDELGSGLSRMAVCSLVADTENAFSIEDRSENQEGKPPVNDRAVFRSKSTDHCDKHFVFNLERDTSTKIMGLLHETADVNVRSSFVAPFWTRDDGTAYGLNTDLPPHVYELYKKRTIEIIESGNISEEMALIYQKHGIDSNPTGVYIEHLLGLYKEYPQLLNMYERLLTTEERDEMAKAADKAVRAYLFRRGHDFVQSRSSNSTTLDITN